LEKTSCVAFPLYNIHMYPPQHVSQEDLAPCTFALEDLNHENSSDKIFCAKIMNHLQFHFLMHSNEIAKGSFFLSSLHEQ